MSTIRALCLCIALASATFAGGQEWTSWGGDPGGSRFSPLQDINRQNVSTLKPAWTFHTGEIVHQRENFQPDRVTAFESTPLVVDGVMYLSAPSGKIFAVNAETGEKKWSFYPSYHVSRTKTLRSVFVTVCLIVLAISGRSRWLSTLPRKVAVCALLAYLIVTMRHSFADLIKTPVYHPHRGVSYWKSADGRDRRIIVGIFSTLYALDADTGRPVRNFGDLGQVDLRKGITDSWPEAIYAVTSPPAIYRDLVIVGAEVPEAPSIGPSGEVRAFHAKTGQLVWTFHTLPHPGEAGYETWEPGATTNRTGGNVWSIMSVDAEHGIVYLPIGSASSDFYGADRKGNNLYANSLVALNAQTGQLIWHFQMVHHDTWDYDLPAQPLLTTVHRNGEAIPAVAQVTKMGYVFILNRLTGVPLFPVQEREFPKSDLPGEQLSKTQPIPSKPPPLSTQVMNIADLRDSQTCKAFLGAATSNGIYSPQSTKSTLQTPGEIGGGNWSGASTDPASGLLFVNTNNLFSIGSMSPSKVEGYRRSADEREHAFFWDETGTPCQKPPWGMLSAVNLATGEIVWKTELGTVNLGGSIATAGGLVFLGATSDNMFRAFDSTSGRELWKFELPASAHATPVTYKGKTTGRQFVAVAAGGGGAFHGRVSDAVVAFSN